MLIIIALLLFVLTLSYEPAREILAGLVGVLICLLALVACAGIFLWMVGGA